MVKQIFVLLMTFMAFIAVAPPIVSQEVVMLNDLVNGDFEESFKPAVGFTYSGGPPRQWKMAAPWWIGEGNTISPGAGGKGQCLRISGAESGVYQPVGLVPGLGGKLRVVGEARSADGGVLFVSVTDAAGTTASFTFRPTAHRWTRFCFDAGAALQRAAGKPPTGPCEIRLKADGGPVLVDNMQALCAYKRVDPKAFCAKVLRDAAWAFDMQLRYATDMDRGVPLEVRLYDVRTGKPIQPVAASVHDDSVYRNLPLMYALTKNRRWRDIALAHARFAVEKCTDPQTGLSGAYDPATGKLDPTHATGPLEYVQLFAWAARESSDPRFIQAIRTVCDAYLRYARLENGRLCNNTYPDGRRHFANGEDYRCYDMLPAQAMAVAYDATGDRKYAVAARDALKPFMERGQWREWFDDPFGIPMNGTLAVYLLTGQPEMLEATRQGAEFWFDKWVNALQHGGWCAGDDPRTWPIYCYLGIRDKKQEYIQTAKKHFLYVMKCQAFGGHWVEQYHFQYRPYPGFEYPPFNAMNGAGTIYGFTRDRDVLTRLAALYDDWNAFFRCRYGYRFTPDPKQPETTQWMHENTARVLGTVLRAVATIQGVRVSPYAYLMYPASKREAEALAVQVKASALFGPLLPVVHTH